MTQYCHSGSSLFRAGVNSFQLPQAILAFFGNWLTPKRKILRVIRCLTAGNYCASQDRSLCLALPLVIRDGVNAKVFPDVIGWGRANASRSASRYYSSIP